MLGPTTKIMKPKGRKPGDFKFSISKALLDLEVNLNLKALLRGLKTTASKKLKFVVVGKFS